MARLRILCVHGLGDHRGTPWREEWEQAIRAGFGPRDGLTLEFDFHGYDHIFEQTDLSAWEITVAVGKLLGSGISSLFRGGPAGARGGAASDRRSGGRGVGDIVRWSAGYVVAWTEDRGFQRRTRREFLKKLQSSRPDVVVAHSLGSLITYNALTHDDARTATLQPLVAGLTYVSLGSQIGNPFVVGNLTHGRVLPLPTRRWFHLYNDEDAVFTAPIRLWDASHFRQVDTPFDIAGMADHAAVEYLRHRATRLEVWDPLAWEAQAAVGPKALRSGPPPLVRPTVTVATRRPAARAVARKPRRRAVLIGINDYPTASDRLEGCVNDAYLMSAVLQERGFAAEDIRVCLDRRATSRGILERLEWLLDAPRPDDELVFYYSGHGAQLPTYGAGDSVDRMDETLVPWDFDWSAERCITDDQIFTLYSQLPYGTRLLTIFDCCHSGGIHRAGAPRAKGLNPPDDIRHRELRWDGTREMWVSRKLHLASRSAGFAADEESRQAYFGGRGATCRLGRGSAVRALDLDAEAYAAAKRAAGRAARASGGGSGRPIGPYLPVILEACAEAEYAYEYRHGAVSHGAFTYSLATILRRERPGSWSALITRVGDQLRELEYAQTPQILGPAAILSQPPPAPRKSESRNR